MRSYAAHTEERERERLKTMMTDPAAHAMVTPVDFPHPTETSAVNSGQWMLGADNCLNKQISSTLDSQLSRTDYKEFFASLGLCV